MFRSCCESNDPCSSHLQLNLSRPTQNLRGMVVNSVGYFGFETFVNLLKVSYSASEKLVSIVKDMQKFSVLRIVKFFLESQFRKIWSWNKSFVINL